MDLIKTANLGACHALFQSTHKCSAPLERQGWTICHRYLKKKNHRIPNQWPLRRCWLQFNGFSISITVHVITINLCEIESSRFLRNINAKSDWVMKENAHLWDFPQFLSVLKKNPKGHISSSLFFFFFWYELSISLGRRERSWRNKKSLLNETLN